MGSPGASKAPCSKYINLSIKIQNVAFARCFGSAPVQWSEATNRLTRPCSKTLFCVAWIFEQVGGDFICGIVFPCWGIFFATNIQVINYFMFMVMLCSSIVQIGVAKQLWLSGEDTISGVNFLLECQYQLFRAYPAILANLEKRWSKKCQVVGGILVLATGFTPLFIILSQLGVVFNFDPLYYIFSSILPPEHKSNWSVVSVLCVSVRILMMFLFTLSAVRNMCFMFVYCFHTIMAYLSICTILRSVSDVDKVIKSYHRLAQIHQINSLFANNSIGLLMFLGHTCCICMFWLSIRGWGIAPSFVIAFFPFSGTIIFVWLIMILTAFSGVSTVSVRLLLKLRHRVIAKSGIYQRRYLVRILRAATPVYFKSGNWIVVSKDSPGNFILTVVENLTSAVLTF